MGREKGLAMGLKEFQVVGRRLPGRSEGNQPKIYKMRIFARNEVVAKSRFWYFLSFLRKLRKSDGEILACREIFEQKPTTTIVKAKNCKRPRTKQLHNSSIKFPLAHRVPRASHRRFKTTFKAQRPHTYF